MAHIKQFNEFQKSYKKGDHMITTTKLNNMPCIIADDILVFDPNAPVSAYANAMSGSFTYPSGSIPCSILINNGKTIFPTACHSWLGYPETVLYRYKDGAFGVKKCLSAMDIPNRSKVLWAVGGVGLLDQYHPNEEGFCKIAKDGKFYNYSDVLRDTDHTALGVKDGKCHLIYCNSMTASQVNTFAIKCDFQYAVMLDGGHMAAMNGSEPYSKINTAQKQGYAIQGIHSNFANIATPKPEAPKPTPPSKKYTVALDAGHSPLVSGKQSPDGTYKEYECNIAIVGKMQKHLIRHGVTAPYVDYIHKNATAELKELVKRINITKADLCVSIHSNAFGTGFNSANGWEIFTYKNMGESKRLAESIHKESIPYLGLTDRGIKDGRHLAVVRDTIMPCVLIESAFHTNKEDLAKLKSEEFREKCAIAYSKGILKYLNIKWTSL